MWSMNIDIHSTPRARRSGYTLVEMLLSVVLTLMLMYAVAQIFSMVGTSVNDSRALLALGDRLRATKARLELDLDGVTSRMTPPAEPGDSEGYFELIEGPVGPTVPLVSTATVTARARNVDDPSNPTDDTTAIDYDDILMFTTRTTTNEPFIGRAGTGNPIESRFAEVAWFVRGRTLYRRVKIIQPDYATDLHCQTLYGATLFPNGSSPNINDFAGDVDLSGGVLSGITDVEALAFENQFDLSARLEGTVANAGTWGWVPNSLSDLTRRENRMYHAPIIPTSITTSYLEDRFPFAVHDTIQWQTLGLPTIGETSNLNWMVYQWNRFATNSGPELPVLTAWGAGLAGRPLTGNTTGLDPDNQEVDFWNASSPYGELDPNTGNITETVLQTAVENLPGSTAGFHEHQRVGEDVILNNVVGFDVKVWDPEAPVITDETNILKPGDPGFPRNYQDHGTTIESPRMIAGVTDYSGSTTIYPVVSRGAFVDLGCNYRSTLLGFGDTSILAGYMNNKSGFLNPDLTGAAAQWVNPPNTTPPFVYDTWSTHYEFDGIDQDSSTTYRDAGFDGLDNNTNNLVDDEAEFDTMPPYSAPLQAIQIKIRVFEPKSQKIREVTIVHRF